MRSSPTPIKAIIVDDEQPARLILRSMLGQSIHPIEVVAEADGVTSALEAISRTAPNLLFLDINLFPGSGFDILNQCQAAAMEVIFITAHDQYAIKAIKASALDYLIKPISQDELDQAIARCSALENLYPKEGFPSASRLEIFRENLVGKENLFSRIVLPTLHGFKVIPISEITYVQADRSYTMFHLLGGKKIACSRTLKHYDEILSGHGFFRSHQSWLINIAFVSEFERRKKGGRITMQDQYEVPLSESARKAFQSLFLG